MNYGSTAEKMPDIAKDSMAPSIVKRFDSNLERMCGSINRIEDQLHQILNNRRPQSEGKSETPMENDFDSAVNNRLISFSLLNDRLENLVSHLNKIVG